MLTSLYDRFNEPDLPPLYDCLRRLKSLSSARISSLDLTLLSASKSVYSYTGLIDLIDKLNSFRN